MTVKQSAKIGVETKTLGQNIHRKFNTLNTLIL